MKPYNNQKISTLLTQITGQLNKNIFKDHETDLNWTYIPQANRNFESELMVDFKNTEFYMTHDFISVGSFKRCVWRLGCLSKSKHIEIIKKENFDDIKYKIIQHLNDIKENQSIPYLKQLETSPWFIKEIQSCLEKELCNSELLKQIYWNNSPVKVKAFEAKSYCTLQGGVLPSRFSFFGTVFSGKNQPLDSFWIESNNIIKKIDFSEQTINFEKATDKNSAGIICLKSRPKWNLEEYLDSWIDFNLFKKNHNKALYLSNLLKEFGLWKPEYLKRHSLIQTLSKYRDNTFDQNWLNIVKAFQAWPEVPETILKNGSWKKEGIEEWHLIILKII